MQKLQKMLTIWVNRTLAGIFVDLIDAVAESTSSRPENILNAICSLARTSRRCREFLPKVTNFPDQFTICVVNKPRDLMIGDFANIFRLG